MSEKIEKLDLEINSASERNLSASAQDVKKIFFKHLQIHVKKFFANIDDSLFEYSDKASDNEQQAVYLAAMRDIRKDQKAVMQLFFNGLEKSYEDTLAGIGISSENNSDSSEDVSYSSLSLVEDDDLEESLAIENMIEKSHGLHREELMPVGKRFDHIITNAEITSENCPVSPSHICRSFEKAAEKLSINLDIKLIVFKIAVTYPIISKKTPMICCFVKNI